MTYFCVTIDTECDMPNWKPKKDLTINNIKALPKLHDLFDKYEIKPTYLVTYPIATMPLGIDTLRSLKIRNNCEIGTHFHPWTTPPISDIEISNATFPHKLDEKLHKTKLINLTNTIKKSFKISPKSYRAGRFGFDRIGLKIIEELNYEVDTSITPLTNWGMDFRKASVVPYFLDSENLCKPGASKILEVPVTIDINLPKSIKNIYKLSPEKIKGAFSYLGIRRLWLRPSLSSSKEMIKISKILINNKVPVLNMMFHSNELTVDGSPYNKNERDIDNYFLKLEEFIKFINSIEVETKTLYEFSQLYKN